MEDRVFQPVKLEGFETELFAQFNVKGRGGLDPFSVQEDAGVAVPMKYVCLHFFPQSARSIGWLREHRRNPPGSVYPTPGSRPSRSAALGTHQASPDFQGGGSLRPLAVRSKQVGIVFDSVPDRIVEADGLIRLIGGIAGMPEGEITDGFVIGFYNGRGPQMLRALDPWKYSLLVGFFGGTRSWDLLSLASKTEGHRTAQYTIAGIVSLQCLTIEFQLPPQQVPKLAKGEPVCP